MPKKTLEFCHRGHEIAVTSRDKYGRCIPCRNMKAKIHDKLVAEKKRDIKLLELSKEIVNEITNSNFSKPNMIMIVSTVLKNSNQIKKRE